MEPNYIDVLTGKLLRSRMVKREVSAADLAEVLGVSAAHANRLLQGERHWHLVAIAQASEWLGLDCDIVCRTVLAEARIVAADEAHDKRAGCHA